MIEHPAITQAETYGQSEPEPVCHCDKCGYGITWGEDYYDVDGQYICDVCMDKCRKVGRDVA